ncbi:Hypothetical Protein RRSL_03563 [Ralstonia solanacearum UW551]|uniref:Uncharacterized protein n=1 Tax=Ralstonia solanacearum (strain UW551) TaxID=342110 RepID=A0AB33VG33_RALSU|nr:Hypothetical Protein RRSL_03563 [Ralstonia solanacearum UW551]
MLCPFAWTHTAPYRHARTRHRGIPRLTWVTFAQPTRAGTSNVTTAISRAPLKSGDQRPAPAACARRHPDRRGQGKPIGAGAPPHTAATRISICQPIRLRSTARAVRCPLNTIPRGVS